MCGERRDEQPAAMSSTACVSPVVFADVSPTIQFAPTTGETHASQRAPRVAQPRDIARQPVPKPTRSLAAARADAPGTHPNPRLQSKRAGPAATRAPGPRASPRVGEKRPGTRAGPAARAPGQRATPAAHVCMRPLRSARPRALASSSRALVRSPVSGPKRRRDERGSTRSLSFTGVDLNHRDPEAGDFST